MLNRFLFLTLHFFCCIAICADLHAYDGILETQTTGKKLFVLQLSGTPYELGLQHGQQLKNAIADNVKRVVDEKILANKELPQIKSFLAQLPDVLKYVPNDYLEEIKGISDATGISYDKLLILNLFPEMFHCTGLTVEGSATKQGELYHVRVLDYAAGAGLQDTAVLMIVKPDGKIPFLNVSYAGFIGSVTGMNAKKIAIGEIGGKGYGEYLGMPMAFLLRMILEGADNLENVKDFLSKTARTCEYYYVFSDGKTKRSLGVYATGKQLNYIEPGSTYAIVDDRSIGAHDNKLMLGPSQIETSAYQTVLYLDSEKKSILSVIHQQPPHCLALIGFSNPQRYPILIDRLLERYGKIDAAELQEIVKAPVSRPGNLHNAIFAPATLDVWIAHAGPNGEPASDQPYYHVNLDTILRSGKYE